LTHRNGSIHQAIQGHPLDRNVLVHAWDSDDFFALTHDLGDARASFHPPFEERLDA
jgi:hypothetical protein